MDTNAIQIILDEFNSGLLSYLKQVPDRKIASLYNTLGNTLLAAYDTNIDFSLVKSIVSQELNIQSNNNLDFIYKLFNFTESKSRNAEYTKADSYDGMIKIYKRRIKNCNSKEDQEFFNKEINVLIQKIDNINNLLNRH